MYPKIYLLRVFGLSLVILLLLGCSEAASADIQVGDCFANTYAATANRHAKPSSDKLANTYSYLHSNAYSNRHTNPLPYLYADCHSHTYIRPTHRHSRAFHPYTHADLYPGTTY
jgi:hypothetical protein